MPSETPGKARANSEPKVTMSAVKLDRDGNVVETISFNKVEAQISPGFLEQMRQAAKEGWKAKPGNQDDKGAK